MHSRTYPYRPLLRLEGRRLKNTIWDTVKPMLEEWTGEHLKATSLYGIRVYKNGGILAPHVDRLPLVTSAIINVDQDLGELSLISTTAVHSSSD